MTTAGQPIFRFAPSPNGRLHLGHAYSALLNADLALRLGGRLLLRIEDIDPARAHPDLVAAIISDLAWLGLRFEEPVRHQSLHRSEYRAALDRLTAQGLAYPCFCTRGDIRAATAVVWAPDPDGAPLYPGTCRSLAPGVAADRAATEPHAWRLDTARALAVAPGPHAYRASGAPSETEGPSPVGDGTEAGPPAAERRIAADPARWGDPVIARRDVGMSYHLAVVVDDAVQGITHVVRGRDLEAATDLHVLLQALLGLETPRYHHHRLILGPDGAKLAKSKGSQTLAELRAHGVTSDSLRTDLGFA